MFILDSLLIGSLRFVLDKVIAAAETEAQDDSALRDQLLEAQMQLELGEITDQESAFDAKVKQIAGRFDKLTFKYTGPWPPYNFVNIRLKLERA